MGLGSNLDFVATVDLFIELTIEMRPELQGGASHTKIEDMALQTEE